MTEILAVLAAFAAVRDGALTVVTSEQALREALTRPVPFLALPAKETA